jgi:hypothetical protein
MEQLDDRYRFAISNAGWDKIETMAMEFAETAQRFEHDLNVCG